MVLDLHFVITCVRYKPTKLRKNIERKIIQAFPENTFMHNKRKKLMSTQCKKEYTTGIKTNRVVFKLHE